MGLFSGIQNNIKKSEAAVVIQNLLELQTKWGAYDGDPAKQATSLVQAIWDQRPDVFSGKFGVRPHKLALAAAALSNGLFDHQHNHRLSASLLLALGEILKAVDANGGLYQFNNIDQTLFKASLESYVEASEAGKQSTSGDPTNAAAVDDPFSKIAELSALYLGTFLQLHERANRFNSKLHEEFMRGYLVGFCDGCAQHRGLQFTSDEAFFTYVIKFHTALLEKYVPDPARFAIASLKSQGNSEFDRGHNIGGKEAFDALGEPSTYPTTFVDYLMAP